MLQEILKVFHGDELLNLNELARRLNVAPTALDGMLETLVRQGKLRRVASADSVCRTCQQRPPAQNNPVKRHSGHLVCSRQRVGMKLLLFVANERAAAEP